MVQIYILELEKNKFYVGKTHNLEERLKSHFSEEGSGWTKKYKPIKVNKTFEGDDFDEDKTLITLMATHGIENVRGGSFSQIKLSQKQQDMLKTMINSGKDNCFKCGKSGHFAKDCKNLTCKRCGRDNHLEKDCYAKKGLDGKPLLFCKRCGRDNHDEVDCVAKRGVDGKQLDKEGCIIC